MCRKALPLFALLITGCSFSVTKDSDVGFRFGTEVAVFQNGPDEGSEVRYDALPWVQDLIQKEQEYQHEIQQLKQELEELKAQLSESDGPSDPG